MSMEGTRFRFYMVLITTGPPKKNDGLCPWHLQSDTFVDAEFQVQPGFRSLPPF